MTEQGVEPWTLSLGSWCSIHWAMRPLRGERRKNHDSSANAQNYCITIQNKLCMSARKRKKPSTASSSFKPKMARGALRPSPLTFQSKRTKDERASHRQKCVDDTRVHARSRTHTRKKNIKGNTAPTAQPSHVLKTRCFVPSYSQNPQS